MTLPGKFTFAAAAVLAIAAAFTIGHCEGRAEQQLDAAGDTADVRAARLVAQIVLLEADRRRDSTARAADLAAAAETSAAALRRADVLEAALKARGPLPADVQAVIDALRAALATQTKELAAKDKSIAFWQATAAARALERDTALAQRDEYRDQRDAWKKRARSRCGLDVGVGAISRRADVYVGCRIPLPRLPFL